MAAKPVPLNGSVLAWAREEAGLTRAQLALALDTEERVVSEWEDGSAQPTKGQFSGLAKALKRPSALFFLPEPPARGAIPTSFRLAPGLGDHRLTADEVRQIRWARRLQEIVAWALGDSGERTVQIESFSTKTDPRASASYLRAMLEVLPAEQLDWDNPNEALRAWRSKLEEAGILILQLSLGKGNVRGFSAWDDRAPLIAISTAYHPTARIFTLFHEVGHLLTRIDAACLRFILPTDPEIGAERWCERFSAEFLLPEDALRHVATRMGVAANQPVTDVETARKIAARFKVSTRAAALRLQELSLAPAGFYAQVERALAKYDWNPERKGGGGQPRPEKRLGQLGTRIPEVLLDAHASGRVNRADLADYLNLTTGQVDELRSLVNTRA